MHTQHRKHNYGDSKYKQKYLKYKRKYLQLKGQVGGSTDIVGNTDPDKNYIIKHNYSDHYLIKKIVKHEDVNLVLYNLNIAQRNKFKTVTIFDRLSNFLRSKENLSFTENIDKKNTIFKSIFDFVKDNYYQIDKFSRVIDETDEYILDSGDPLFVKLEKQISKQFKLPIETIHIKKYKNANLDIDGESTFSKTLRLLFLERYKSISDIYDNGADKNYYVMDIVFSVESNEEYVNRLQKCLKFIHKNITKDKMTIENAKFIINLQEISPIDKLIKYIPISNFNDDFDLIYKQGQPSTDTYTVSFVDKSLHYSNAENDDIVTMFNKKDKKSPSQLIKLYSESFPDLYNFHTVLFRDDEFKSLIKELISNVGDKKFILCGDFNLRLSDIVITYITKLLGKHNIMISLTPTPEKHYPENYFTYDVFIYRV